MKTEKSKQVASLSLPNPSRVSSLLFLVKIIKNSDSSVNLSQQVIFKANSWHFRTGFLHKASFSMTKILGVDFNKNPIQTIIWVWTQT